MNERVNTILSLVDQLTVERRNCADKARALAMEHARLGEVLKAAVTLADHLNIQLPPDVFEADAAAVPGATAAQKTAPVSPTPVWIPGDPDPDRAGSGWDYQKDIELLEDVAQGMAGTNLAELYNCSLDEVTARIQLLHPTNDPRQIGQVIQSLKTLREGAAA